MSWSYDMDLDEYSDGVRTVTGAQLTAMSWQECHDKYPELLFYRRPPPPATIVPQKQEQD